MKLYEQTKIKFIALIYVQPTNLKRVMDDEIELKR